jgi:very-short-patch-repair endonuclease
VGAFTQRPVGSQLPQTTRHRQLHFDRLSAGIPDFVCIKKKLIVELDGGQHLEQQEYDAERTKYFESLGYKVIRFWNKDVAQDIEGVIRAILVALEE